MIAIIRLKLSLPSFETWFIWKWIFKTFVAVELITHTFDFTMAVFDVSQTVVNQAGGIIQGSRDALINCNFSGDIMEGVDRSEEFIRNAYLLREMRKDYELFNLQLSILGKEKESFEQYLRGEKSLVDIAEQEGITYESAKMRIHRSRLKVKNQVVSFMEGKRGIA